MELCKGCNHSFIEFCGILSNQIKLNEFLCDHRVILAKKTCPNCGEETKVVQIRGKPYFRCQRRTPTYKGKKKIQTKCSFKQSLQKNTFFAGSHLPTEQICSFVAFECLDMKAPTLFVENELQWSRETVINWRNFIREVYMHWAGNNSTGKLGGPGKIVEIDETKVGQRKYNRGRIVEGQWVFGIFDRETSQIYMVPVKDRSAETLMKIIEDKIEEGTIIISDIWKSYAGLKEHPNYQYYDVNHSENVVDPKTGAHTQNIERHWRNFKDTIPKYGRKKEHFLGYMAEFLFKRQYPNHRIRLHALFTAIGELYDPNINIEFDDNFRYSDSEYEIDEDELNYSM